MGSCCSAHVVTAGDRVGITDDAGRFDIVAGPARLARSGREFQLLTRHTATKDQYLAVRFRDGHTEFMRGPVCLYEDPTQHAQVEHHSVVVVPKGEQAAVWTAGNMKLVDGPETLVPGHDEVRMLTKHAASREQYILVTMKDGEKKVLEGPTVVYDNPMLYNDVVVEDVILLTETQRVHILEHDGTRTVVEGPARVVAGDREVEEIQQYVASVQEYLSVWFHDGKVQHTPGPTTAYLDPLLHAKIEVRPVVTVPAGRRVALWEEDGQCTLVDGPTALVPGERAVKNLEAHRANDNQYLHITFRDGHAETLPGPISVFQHPVLHRRVAVKDCIAVNSGEVLVVYHKSEEDRAEGPPLLGVVSAGAGGGGGGVGGGGGGGGGGDGAARRKLVRGPTIYVPGPEEWLHEFVWHGKDPNDPGGKVPGALRFQKLQDVPGQFYYNVRDVRTADDALLLCKLMVFFELIDLETMLDSTMDPIGDFINAVSADIISFATALPYELFVEKTSTLNDLENYPNLVERAQKIGYNISKVVYRGYEASSQLQKMHNDAIERRTKLRLDGETEEKLQQVEDLKLHKEMDRARRRQELESHEQEHKMRLASVLHDESTRQKHVENELRVAQMKKQNAQELKYLDELHGMGLNMTEYMVTKEAAAPDKLVQIATGEGGVTLNQKLVLGDM